MDHRVGADHDRAALVNYATFLALERRQVCAELYPHRGVRAGNFVLALNEAWRFFCIDANDPRFREDVPKASTRAVQVLDLVGIDWRRDAGKGGVAVDYEDDGQRPALPHGWPAPDAALLEALDDLTRLDAAQRAIYEAGDPSRHGDRVPGYGDLEDARDAALYRIGHEPAESLTGLQVKARALLTRSVEEGGGELFHGIALSLARDLLGLGQAAVEPRPDPIFAVIEETWRLTIEHDRLHAVCASRPDDDPSWEPARGAHDAMWSYVDDTLAKTVPRTGEGCRALARFARDFVASQGVPVVAGDDGNLGLFALIARSPLL